MVAARKLSTTTVRLIRATLSVVFQSAVDDRIIDRNPVASARTSRRSRKARAANRVAVAKERVFTEAQQIAILSWCSEHDQELHDLFFLVLRSGLRPGECRALG
jgi:integrase